MKRIITSFAYRIDILDMNELSMEKTIGIMKNKDDLKYKIVEFIGNADLYMDDFKYAELEDVILKTDSYEIAEDEIKDKSENLSDHII